MMVMGSATLILLMHTASPDTTVVVIGKPVRSLPQAFLGASDWWVGPYAKGGEESKKESLDITGKMGLSFARLRGGSQGQINVSFPEPKLFNRTAADRDPHIEFAKALGVTMMEQIPAEGTDGDVVKYALDMIHWTNEVKRYGVLYWEIGNEQYSLSPEHIRFFGGDPRPPTEEEIKQGKVYWTAGTWARRVLLIAKAIKERYPHLKVVANGWCYSRAGGGLHDKYSPAWNRAILEVANNYIDGLEVHEYLWGSKYKGVLDDYYNYCEWAQSSEGASQVRALIDRYGKTQQLIIGECNIMFGKHHVDGTIAYAPMWHTMAHAIVLADFLGRLFSTGADVIAIHTLAHVPSSLWSWRYPTGKPYDRSGPVDGGVATGFVATPAYYAVQMFGQRWGRTVLSVDVSEPGEIASGIHQVRAYASRQGKRLYLLLLNCSPTTEVRSVTVRFPYKVQLVSKWTLTGRSLEDSAWLEPMTPECHPNPQRPVPVKESLSQHGRTFIFDLPAHALMSIECEV